MNGSVYNTQALYEYNQVYLSLRHLSASQSPNSVGMKPCVVSSTSSLGRFSG